MGKRVSVTLRDDVALEVMAALDAITGVPPVAPTNDQANLLNDFGIRIGAALLYATPAPTWTCDLHATTTATDCPKCDAELIALTEVDAADGGAR